MEEVNVMWCLLFAGVALSVATSLSDVKFMCSICTVFVGLYIIIRRYKKTLQEVELKLEKTREKFERFEEIFDKNSQMITADKKGMKDSQWVVQEIIDELKKTVDANSRNLCELGEQLKVLQRGLDLQKMKKAIQNNKRKLEVLSKIVEEGEKKASEQGEIIAILQSELNEFVLFFQKENSHLKSMNEICMEKIQSHQNEGITHANQTSMNFEKIDVAYDESSRKIDLLSMAVTKGDGKLAELRQLINVLQKENILLKSKSDETEKTLSEQEKSFENLQKEYTKAIKNLQKEYEKYIKNLESPKCSICLELPNDCRKCPSCLQPFCNECISRWLGQTSNSKCPYCRSALQARSLVKPCHR